MSFLFRFFESVGLLKRKVNVLVVGLDNSGKTSILHWLKPPSEKESIQEIIPTVGFSVEQLQRGKLSLTVFDMSGQGRYRTLWEHYYPDAEAIIFVMDATDRSRASMAREELDALLDHEAVRQRPIPVLVLANKSDLTQAMLASECSNFLGLDRIKQRPWSISACSALTGEGLTPGLDWLLERL